MLKSIITPKLLYQKEILHLQLVMNSIIKAIIFRISQLPLPVLYRFSDVLFFFQKHVIRYRRDVVINNLKKSFPDKTESEIYAIAYEQFKHFCDFLVETIKGLSITPEELDVRVVFNHDVTNKIFAEDKHVMLLCGHLYNWEWVKIMTKRMPTPDMYAVYKTPKSKLGNDLVKKGREGFGGEMIAMNNVKFLLEKILSKQKALFMMVADQSPFRKDIHYDLEFMHQTTPVYQGFDKLIRKGNVGVVYLNIRREGRGKYVYKPVEITPDGEKFKPNEVVHKFFALLEENIRQDPANYMWTHKRWKYKKGIDY